jgi:hypothetical protein
MSWEDIVWCCVMLGAVYWWAIRSIFKNRTKFMSTEFTSAPKQDHYMNRVPDLYPENAIIDVYWEDVTEEFSRGMKPHHLMNLTVFALLAIYYLSDWIAKFIVWLIFIIT